jgi:hypothetical protein
MTVYIACAPDFHDLSMVADGASMAISTALGAMRCPHAAPLGCKRCHLVRPSKSNSSRQPTASAARRTDFGAPSFAHRTKARRNRWSDRFGALQVVT